MRLIDYMRAENLDDAAMASRVGGISPFGIRKLKYGERGPSIEVAIRIDEVSHGKVGLRDWAKDTVSGESQSASVAVDPKATAAEALRETPHEPTCIDPVGFTPVEPEAV